MYYSPLLASRLPLVVLFCLTNVRWSLLNMSLGGCERIGKMFANELRGEAGPSDVIAGINGRGSCRYDWAESGKM